MGLSDDGPIAPPPPITPAPTSVAAFVGHTASGPTDQPLTVRSFAEFETAFGGLDATSELAYALRLFFANGGREAVVVRVAGPGGGPALPGAVELIGDPASSSGLQALRGVEFNLLAIPDATRAKPGAPGQLDDGLDPAAVFGAALALCRERRAFLLVDPPPAVADARQAVAWKTASPGLQEPDGAAYFPRLVIADPLAGGAPRAVTPSGAVAGVYAQTDATRGVWKSPAGGEAPLQGVESLERALTLLETRELTAVGLNALRTFPVLGHLVWGARTLAGADSLASDWRYVAVRRLALLIEESLDRGLAWTVGETNGDGLWAAVRAAVDAFFLGLFRSGALQGLTSDEAWFVECDRTTMSRDDIEAGRLNITVGFAPLRPAEFVVLRLGRWLVAPP